VVQWATEFDLLLPSRLDASSTSTLHCGSVNTSPRDVDISAAN